jgi:tripartite-type tricarboxylate transporter receptor subunit TctC
VIDNRPGAGGNIGTQLAAQAPKDGHSLLMTISSSQAINPALYKHPGFDPVKDFKPISLIGTVPNVLLVHPSFAAKSVAELLAMAKGKPNDLPYASAGNGTLNHLLGEMLGSMAGVKLQHVPYKGVAPALNDVLGGQLPMLFASLPSALAHIKSGRLRALAVSGATRSPVLPDLPTIAETLPGYEAVSWQAIFAPAKTPREVIQKLADVAARAAQAPEIRSRLEGMGQEVVGGTPEQLDARVKGDLAVYARIVREAKIPLQD